MRQKSPAEKNVGFGNPYQNIFPYVILLVTCNSRIRLKDIHIKKQNYYYELT